MSATAVMPSFDRLGLLNDIKAGYYRSEMAPRRDPKTLERQQDDRARDEDRFAREARQPAEERAHRRRADKAAYLRDKLAEAERADREQDR
ncbi:MAG TPA: hypothetical protein VFG42_10745 [Baekduia sp.]|uniref:hypothetical protein n=1 Tax=Baekduia sp. TaxID=2600305 RepID=UPI002D785C9A|nr:hypothetical protein [Baekduia sp.]HET6507258.1 hypothetical protein [Baekduia sp.]